MTMVITTAGIRSLDTYNGTFKAWLRTLTLKLFKNNRVPAVTDVIGDYTPANFDGYADQALSTFGDPSLNGNSHDVFSDADKTFTMTGAVTPNTIYGYLYVDGAGVLCVAEDNGGGFAMVGAGYTYTVAPRFYVGQMTGPA